MDKEIKKYRENHPKCKWCKYYRYRSPSSKILGLEVGDYEECILKDKIIHFTNYYKICKYYKIKEEEEDEI